MQPPQQRSHAVQQPAPTPSLQPIRRGDLIRLADGTEARVKRLQKIRSCACLALPHTRAFLCISHGSLLTPIDEPQPPVTTEPAA